MSADKEVPLLTAEIAHAWCDADEVELLVPPNELIDGMEAIAEGRSQCCIVPTRSDIDATFNAWRQQHWPHVTPGVSLMMHHAFNAALAQYGFKVKEA